MLIYLVWDENNDALVSAHKSMSGAREALLNFLKTETGYTTEEWEEFAHDNGYDTVEEFQDAIRVMPDYDEELQMRIEGETLQE